MTSPLLLLLINLVSCIPIKTDLAKFVIPSLALNGHNTARDVAPFRGMVHSSGSSFKDPFLELLSFPENTVTKDINSDLTSKINNLLIPASASFPQKLKLNLNSQDIVKGKGLNLKRQSITFVLKKTTQDQIDSVEFEGYDTMRPKIPLLIKIYKPNADQYMRTTRESFTNELNALNKLSRLVVSDSKNLLLVHQKVIGTRLDDLLSSTHDTVAIQRLIDQYLELPLQFSKEWNLVHLDVDPKNVIVDPHGRMHLINFSKTQELHDQGQLLFDQLIAWGAIGKSSGQFPF